jgi:hypothetical protein
MEVLIPTLTAIAVTIPMIIVWVIGIVLALSRWRRHPRVSQLMLTALALMIGATVVIRALYAWLPIAMRNRGWSMSEYGAFSTAIGIVSTLINAAAWALVISAAFGWRDRRQKENLFPPGPTAFGNEPRERNATPGFAQR